MHFIAIRTVPRLTKPNTITHILQFNRNATASILGMRLHSPNSKQVTSCWAATIMTGILFSSYINSFSAECQTEISRKSDFEEPEMEELALYRICKWNKDEANEIICDETLKKEFDAEKYSLMKYGSRDATMEYAYSLAQLFQHNYPEYFNSSTKSNENKHFIVTSSAYRTMPTAATHLATAFLGFVNEFRMENDLEPVEMTKIDRHVLIAQDYAKMSEKQRDEEMQKNKIDFKAEAVTGRHVIVIDDCSITGSHMRKIQAAAIGLDIKKITYLYVLVAEANRKGMADADLDHYFINSLDRWAKLVSRSDMGPLTARQMKYFLNSKEDIKELKRVIGNVPCSIIYEMYFGCINDGFTTKYKRVFPIVQQAWKDTCQGCNRSNHVQEQSFF